MINTFKHHIAGVAWGLVLCLLVASTPRASADTTIIVPLRFHLVSGIEMKKGDKVMNSWVTKRAIESIVMAEVNRIWKPADIKFQVESVLPSEAKNPGKKAQLVDYIVNAKRDQRGKSDPRRLKKLNQLIDWSDRSENAVNIYVVPYLGEASQGNTSRKQNRIFIAEWTDKASRATKPPRKPLLTESLPYRTGSFSRTLAHELGHMLGLKHPDKQSQKVFGLLMGGKKKGYSLTPQEITTARQSASNLFR